MIAPCWIDIREPSYNAAIKGRLLAKYDARRRLLKIKRADGPEICIDLAELDEKAGADALQTAEGVV